MAAACFAGAAVAWAQAPAKQIMHSSSFDWEKMKAQDTKYGQKRMVFEVPTATLDMLECHITTLNPGEEPHPPHRHVEEEMVFIKEGTLEALQGNERKRLGPGSILFQGSNEFHGVRNVGDTPATYFVLKWTSPGMLKKPAE
jgi:uncharacterized cupin superfamily protein